MALKSALPSKRGQARSGKAAAASAVPPRAARALPPSPLIVGIGASAGGLEAFNSFFAHTRVDTGLAFVLIQHLSPTHKSLLASILARNTPMTVVEATHGTKVTPNGVFVIPPDATMTIRGGCLEIARPAPPRDRRRPIDAFFQSLAEDQGENAVGVILAGTGSDGALGLAVVKEHGGLTLAQAEFDSHAMPGMPQNAQATGQVDEVLAVEAMPARIAAHQHHLKIVAPRKNVDGARPDTTSHLATIIAAVRGAVGHDFSDYKEATLGRRLQRRMQVLRMDDPEAYIDFLKRQPEESERLFREFLIGVTQFFRDPAAFEALAASVLKDLVDGAEADSEIRIWVPACATGEEAFTLAILLREVADAGRPRPRVQIFGTDIDDRAIAIARAGRFRKPVAGLSPERAERWFVSQGDVCTVVPEIREMCIFSTHSLIKHSPFSRLDLISCRNLLIYLNADMQDRVMRTFHYALKPGGRLFMGASESVSRATTLFGVEDKKHRIFRRREDESVVLPDLPNIGRRPETPPTSRARATPLDNRMDQRARRVMEKYYPPHVVLDRRDHILSFSGGAMGEFLEPAQGAASFALFDILRKPLRGPVRAALRQVRTTAAGVHLEQPPFRLQGQSRKVTLIVEPMADQGPDAGLIVLAFRDEGPAGEGVGGESSDKAADEARAIEQELLTTRTQLQSAIDDLEVANEEMKSANEEYQSVNEELQSTNEELETAKEEMQSVNEELQTVNAEMTDKNRQLGAVNSDLKNLLESIEIATLFLDEDLRVRSFTGGVNEIFHLREADVGRPITEIVSLLDYGQLQGDVRTVLRKLAIVEREVTLKDAGMTFILRVRPYRTVDNVIDGVVLTFIDITARHANETLTREAEAYVRLLIDSVADGVYCMDRDGLTTLCNASFRRMFGFDSEAEVIGVALHDVIHHTLPDGRPYPKSQCAMLRTARTGEPAHRDEFFFRTDGKRFPVEYWAQPILREGVLVGAACTMVDVTERRRFSEQQEMLLREMDHRIKNLFAMVGGAVTLSARSATTIKGMSETIHGRLGALAIAHQLIRPNRPISSAVTARSTLDQLVRTVLAPYSDSAGSDPDKRVTLEGPEVSIGGEAVTSLALVLHELATNAAKYGAFAIPTGQLRVSWELKEEKLLFLWQESGGPRVTHAPDREGFGSLLARRSVSGQLEGQLTFEWNPEGLIVRIVAARERLTPAMA